jgi:Cu2+-exporting ATPase
MAPSSGSDVGRQAADFVFMHDSLAAVPFARKIAHRVNHLVQQNFALAIVYNCLAIPAAILGHVTPLVAALAMSGSSIVVVANSMRLRYENRLGYNAYGADEADQGNNSNPRHGPSAVLPGRRFRKKAA